MAAAFRAWQVLRDERARLAAAEQQKASRAEFLAFQLSEIDKIAPQADEDQELVTTRQVLANADRLQRLCADAYTALYEGDDAALAALGTVWKKTADLAALDPKFTPYVEAREAIKSHEIAQLKKAIAALDEATERLAAMVVEKALEDADRAKS